MAGLTRPSEGKARPPMLIVCWLAPGRGTNVTSYVRPWLLGCWLLLLAAAGCLAAGCCWLLAGTGP